MKTSRYFFSIVLVYIVFLLLSVCNAGVSDGHAFQDWGYEILSIIESNHARWDGLYQHTTTQTFSDYAWGQGVMARALVNAATVDSSFLKRAIDQADEFHLRYWCSQSGTSGYNASYGSCGDRYYDDNAWIALSLLGLYELTGDSKYLGWAQDTVVFCMTGENGPGDSPDGGIRWHESQTGGACICATAPTALANLIIYQITGIGSYLTDGLRLYDWMITADDYRYSNGIFHELTEGPRAYQTAVVIQTAIRAYQITSDNSYLQEAQSMAAAVEGHFIDSTTHAFKEIGKWGGHDMTNAYVELYEVDGDIHWLDVVAGYLEYLYANCRDETTGLYPEAWDGTSSTYSEYLIENAAVASAYWKMAGVVGGTKKCIRLHQHCPYGGWLAAFEVGNYTASDIIAAGGQNNDASSLMIDAGYKVTFYDGDNFTGAALVKTADDTCLVDDGWNDRISSMIVEVDPALLGYWQFNDNSGSVATDASGYGHDGQLVNMEPAGWTTGKQCGGLDFDGLDDYIEIPDFKGIFGGTSRTCTAWVKTSDATWYKDIIGWGTYASGQRWLVTLTPSGFVQIAVFDGYQRSTTAVNDGDWHHIAVVLDNDGSPTTGDIRIYIDGVEESGYTTLDTTVNTVAGSNVQVGLYNYNDTADRYFDGLIDEVRIYNYPLMAVEIQAVYEQYVLMADAEPDGDVDFADFAVFAGHWQNSQSCDGDLTCDCVVDMDDLIILINEWLGSI